jgi:hypothetical protein
MALTFGFDSIRDVMAKLERDAAVLQNEEVSGDGFFNFVVTGYSMIDWVKNDPTVPASAKRSAAVQGLYSDQWLKVCGDVATACKHFQLAKRQPIADSTQSTRGWGVGRFGMGGFGVGEESIEIKLNDGTVFDGMQLVHGVVQTWRSFFAAHGI